MLAVVVFILEVIGALGRAVDETGAFSWSMLADIPTATYLLLGASSVALLWRRRSPLIVLAATLAASVVWDLAGLADGPSLAIFVSLYGVGRYTEEDRTSFLAVAAAMVVVVADDLIIEAEQLSVVALSLSAVLLAWYLGRRVKGRGEYLALIEERAEYLERERVAASKRAVNEERARIARELHDLVAHRVSMITIQAGAAQTVAKSDPERAIQAMANVEGAGREALEELRHVLGLLRPEGELEHRLPVHGVSDIPDLVAEMRRAGIDSTFSAQGVPESLPSRVELAAYRIVQEALTNVLKHAGPDPKAEVRLSCQDRVLRIEVLDRGESQSTLPGSGRGLLGMRERATLLGGSFGAGPRLGGGFRVEATIPIESGLE